MATSPEAAPSTIPAAVPEDENPAADDEPAREPSGEYRVGASGPPPNWVAALGGPPDIDRGTPGAAAWHRTQMAPTDEPGPGPSAGSPQIRHRAVASAAMERNPSLRCGADEAFMNRAARKGHAYPSEGEDVNRRDGAGLRGTNLREVGGGPGMPAETGGSAPSHPQGPNVRIPRPNRRL
jgi:hypothetical protein